MKNKIILVLLSLTLVMIVPLALFAADQSANLNNVSVLTENTGQNSDMISADNTGQITDLLNITFSKSLLRETRCPTIEYTINLMGTNLFDGANLSVAEIPGKQAVNSSSNFNMDTRDNASEQLSQGQRYTIGYDCINEFEFTNDSEQYNYTYTTGNDAEKLNRTYHQPMVHLIISG